MTGTPQRQGRAVGDHPDAVLRLKMRTRRVLVGDALLLGGARDSLKLQPYDTDAESFLWLLAAGCSTEALLTANNDPHVRSRHQRWLQQMEDAGILEQVGAPADLDTADAARFDRLLHLLAELAGPERDAFALLRRLRTSTVCVLGAGGLASWVLYNLVCSGVGRLRLLDADTVAMSNLNRSILFSEADVGRLKVDAARDALLRFAPRTEIEVMPVHITAADQLAPALDGVDVLVATGDQPPWLIREWVAVAAQRRRLPYLHPSGGRVGPFWVPDGGTACSMCDWASLVEHNSRQPQLLAAQRRVPPSDPGPLSMIGAMTAAVASIDVFRFLLGLRPYTYGQMWSMGDGFTAEYQPTGRHPRCPLCGTAPVNKRIRPPSDAVAGAPT